MSLPEITEGEFAKIKTICEFLFFDQYIETASFSRFEKCFQPLFNNIEDISFLNIFKDIVGRKKKYITYKRFLKAFLLYKKDNSSICRDTKIFFDKLFNSILKTGDDFVGNNIENQLLYSTGRTGKLRSSITNIQVLVDNYQKIHGITLTYDETYTIEIFPKSLEEKLRIILEMKLDIIDKNFFKYNKKKYKAIKSDLYRDSITHVFGTINKEGFISFIGFKNISGKTLSTGFPEGEGFLFGDFGLKVHDFTIQLNEEGITKLQPGFKKNIRTNYYLDEDNYFSYEELYEDEIIKDEENLKDLTDENEIDKLITTPMIEDNHFFDNDLTDEFFGNDYKEVVNQFPRKWLDKKKFKKSSIINSVDDAMEVFNEEIKKTQIKTTIIENNLNDYYKYNPNQNPFYAPMSKEKAKKFIKNPFFSNYNRSIIMDDDDVNEDRTNILHKTRLYKTRIDFEDEDDGIDGDYYKHINKTEIISKKKFKDEKLRKIYDFFNKSNYDKLTGELAKDIQKQLKKEFGNNINPIQQIFLNKFFPYSKNINEEIISFEGDKIEIDNSEEYENEENVIINEEEKEDDYTIRSNALIFEQKNSKFKIKKRRPLFL